MPTREIRSKIIMPGSLKPKKTPIKGSKKFKQLEGILIALTKSKRCAASKTPRRDAEHITTGMERLKR